MKQEKRLFTTIVSLFSATILTLGLLLILYSTNTLAQFYDLCRQTAATFVSTPTHVIGFFLTILMFSLVTIAGARFISSLIKTQRQVRGYEKVRSQKFRKKIAKINKKHKLSEGLVEIVREDRPIAFCYGIFRQKIILSTGLIEKLSSKELEATLLHENFHVKNHHAGKLLISDLFAKIVFFMPIISELVQLYRIRIEINADHAAASSQGSKRYLRMALAKSIKPHSYRTYLGFATNNWEERTKRLIGKSSFLSYRPMISGKSYVASLAVLLIALLLLSVPLQTSADTNKEVKGNEQRWCGTEPCYEDCISNQDELLDHLTFS